MAASKKFKELLDKIENSNLNYVISKTPFSATISVKSSFVKYHEDSSEKEINVKKEEQTKENDELRSSLLMEILEKEKLQECLEQQTAKVNVLERKLRESGDELKTSKKEKIAAIAEVKSLEKDLNGMKQHSNELCRKIKELENQVKEKANTCQIQRCCLYEREGERRN